MLSDQELQSLRNWGNLAEEAADEICALRAALAAQPAEPVAVMWLYPDGRRYTMTWVGQDEDRMQEMIAERGLIRRELYAAPPAPAQPAEPVKPVEPVDDYDPNPDGIAPGQDSPPRMNAGTGHWE